MSNTVKQFKTRCGLNGRLEQFNDCSSLIYFVDSDNNHIPIPSGITYHNINYPNGLPIPKNYIIILSDGDYNVKRNGKPLLHVNIEIKHTVNLF